MNPMNPRLIRHAALGAALLLGACTTQPAHNAQETTPSAPSAARKVLRTQLDNGLQVVIVRDPLAPVVTQQITYFAGGNETPKGFPGTAHAQEHMMFRGAPGLTGDQLAGIYARMGGDMNAYTTDSMTSYFFTVPRSDLDVALHVGAIRMSGVDDSEKAWKKERGAIEQEVARDHSSPFYGLYEKLLAHMFAGTPYAHDALGTKPSFDKTTGAMLKKFHDKWYAPNNALIVVAGDVQPKAVLAKIRKLYGAIPEKKLPAKPSINLHSVQAKTFTTSTDQPYGIVLLAFRMPGYRSPDYPAAELAAHALGSQRGPIAALRYQGKALAAGFTMQTMPRSGIGLAYALYPPGGNAKQLQQALKAAVRKVRKNGIGADLVKAAKRRAVLGGELRNNSITGLARSWTSAIALAGLESPDEQVARLRKVTPAEVNAQVRDRVDLDHAITLVANPTPGAKPTHGSGYGGAESFGSKPGKPTELPEWAKKALAKLPHPKPFLHPTDMTLSNGIRLIVQPLHVSNSVSLYGSVDQNEDMEAPQGQKGVGDVLGSLFDWGPKGMNRLQFDAAQDAIGANLSVGPNFSLKVLPRYFDQGVELLAKDLTAPAMPSQAFQREQMIQARQAKGQLGSPQFQFQRAVDKALLPKGDPALRIATSKSIMGLTQDKLKAYYDKVYRPDETTIVVVGDITPGKAKAAVEKYFGDWKASGPKPDTAYPPVKPSTASRAFVPDQQRKQNRVVIAETLGLNFTNPDHFALDLANDLLGGGFYASPLYKELREKRGLVYSLRSGFSFTRHRGRYTLAFGAYPDKVDPARKVATKLLARSTAKPMSADQLHLAKAIGLRKLELSSQSVGSIGKGWLNRSEEGLPLDWNYVMARHFEKLTAHEIQQAMHKYLDPKRLSVIVMGQKPGQ